MSEAAEQLLPKTLDERRVAVWEEVSAQQENPAHGDPATARFMASALRLARGSAPYEEMIETHLRHNPTALESHVVRKFLKAHTRLLIPEAVRLETGYPYNFLDEEQTDEFFLRMRNDRAWFNAMRQHFHNGWYRPNVPDRGKSVALLLGANHDKYPDEGPLVVEVGGSKGHILFKFAARDLATVPPALPAGAVGFGHTEVANKEGERADRWLEAAINGLIDYAPFGQGVNIEAHPARTPEEDLDIKNDSLDPLELDRDRARGHLEEEFDLFDEMERSGSMEPWKVRTVVAEFPQLPAHEFERLRGKADVVFFSYSLYQNPYTANDMITAALQLLKPDGHIVVQDHCVINPKDPTKLVFLHHWYLEKWQSSAVVLDAMHPEDGFYEIAQWETGRNRRMRLGQDIGRLIADL